MFKKIIKITVKQIKTFNKTSNWFKILVALIVVLFLFHLFTTKKEAFVQKKKIHCKRKYSRV